LQALPAGNDVEMGGGSYNFATIPALVAAGKLSPDIVDVAVSRLLRAKFSMGLFENPYLGVPASEAASKIHTKETPSVEENCQNSCHWSYGPWFYECKIFVVVCYLKLTSTLVW